jgi:hypothetical protein
MAGWRWPATWRSRRLVVVGGQGDMPHLVADEAVAVEVVHLKED